MSTSIHNLMAAQKMAMSVRPKVGGFPYLAEALRAAGIKRNLWTLPSCQSVYITEHGPVVQQGTPLLSGAAEIPSFNQDTLIHALRTDQNGNSTFPEFLQAAWKAGVVSYDVDFVKRHVIYYGALGESYKEEYPAVELSGATSK